MAKSATRNSSAADQTLEMNPDAVVAEVDMAYQPAPATMHRSHRRPLGAHPVPLLGALGALALVVAIVLLADGAIVGGLVVLMLAVPVLGLFAGGVRREPDAPTAEPTLRAADRVRSAMRLAAVASRGWGGASLELILILGRRRRLRRELKASLTPLGEAVHRGDHERAEALQRRTSALERKLDETDREASTVIARVRDQIDRERTGIEPTEVVGSRARRS